MKSAASSALGLPLDASKKIDPARGPRKQLWGGKGRPSKVAPYARKAGSWASSLKTAIRQACRSRAAREPLEAWIQADARNGWPRTWTAHQMVKGYCHRTSLERALPELLEAGFVELVEAGSHGLRKAAVYRFTSLIPSFSQSAKSPSPGTYKSPTEPCSVPDPLGSKCESPHSPRRGANAGPAGHGIEFSQEELPVVKELSSLGADAAGIRSVVQELRKAPEGLRTACSAAVERIGQAKTYLATEPAWVDRPLAFAVKAAKSPAFAERVQDWLRTAKRWAKVDSKRGKPAGSPSDRRRRRRERIESQAEPPWAHLLRSSAPPVHEHGTFLAGWTDGMDHLRTKLQDLEHQLPERVRNLVAASATQALKGLDGDERARELAWAEAVAMYAWLEGLPGTAPAAAA